MALRVLLLLLACLPLLSLAPHLPGAELWLYDEWYTAERVHNILTRNDWWTLYENGQPVFKKPPLQYWLSAWAQIAGIPSPLSLRLPSFLSALGVLALTAHLARRLSDRPGAALIALVLVLSSTYFWFLSASAMLDLPASLLLTGSIAALFAAWHRPRWWWAVALCLGLGALQKAPVALVALPLAALMLATGRAPARPGRHAAALIPALLLLFLWPAAQGLHHGTEALRIGYVQESALRFAPGLTGWDRALRWTEWVRIDGMLLWGALILAPLALPLWRNTPETRAVALLTATFFLGLTTAKGEVYDRYLMLILPLAAAATGAALSLIPRLQGVVLALILSLSAGGPWKTPFDAGLTQPGIAPYRPILAQFRASLTPAEQPIVCGWGKSDLVLYPGALWLLGSQDKPFRRIWSPEELPRALRIKNIVPPLRGLCLRREFNQLAGAIPLTRIGSDAGWVHWTYP